MMASFEPRNLKHWLEWQISGLVDAGVASPPDVSMDSGLLQRVLGIDMTSSGDALDEMQAALPVVSPLLIEIHWHCTLRML